MRGYEGEPVVESRSSKWLQAVHNIGHIVYGVFQEGSVLKSIITLRLALPLKYIFSKLDILYTVRRFERKFCADYKYLRNLYVKIKSIGTNWLTSDTIMTS